MKILFLSNPKAEYLDQIPNFIKFYGDDVEIFFERLDLKKIQKVEPDFIVSDRYPYIIKEDILNQFKNRAINLHPSYLPWNKGYHPNFWSIYSESIKGVSIHEIDSGIDTGNILCQRQIKFTNEDTLKTSYYKARTALVNLFFENWLDIKNQKIIPVEQYKDNGSHYFKKQYDELWKKFPKGWNTTINEVLRIKKILK